MSDTVPFLSPLVFSLLLAGLAVTPAAAQDDDRLAMGIDVFAPEGYGEIIGGGERATDLDFLKKQIDEHGLPEEVFDWCLDLRKFGSVPHSGLGLRLERTISWICGRDHVRETIPFPRTIARLHP